MKQILRGWLEEASRPFQGVVGMLKLILSLVGASGLATLLSHFEKPISLWIVVVVVLAASYLALTLGVAMMKHRGPWVTVSSLLPDAINYPVTLTAQNGLPYGVVAKGCFYIRVVMGDISAIPRVRIVSAVGDTKETEKGYDAAWRGDRSKEDQVLVAGDPQQFGILGVNQLPSGNPALWIWAKGDEHYALTRDVPLEEQKAVTIRVVLHCSTPKDKDGKSDSGKPQHRTFVIVPAPNSPELYRVLPPPVVEQKTIWQKAYVIVTKVIHDIKYGSDGVRASRQSNGGQR